MKITKFNEKNVAKELAIFLNKYSTSEDVTH